MKRLLLFAVSLTLISFVTSAQIVNVESKRIRTDTTGWAGNIGGEFNVTKNVNTVLETDLYVSLQYNSTKNTYLILGDYSFLKGADKRLINKSFGHFRIDHQLSPSTYLEAFFQFQNNEITKINDRLLWGTGLRFNLLPMHQTLRLVLGISFMYEYEEEATQPVIYNRSFRNSSYFTLNWQPNSLITLISSTFIQPRLDQPSNFRILNQESLKLAITKKLSFTTSWDFLYDTSPATDIPKMNYELNTGLEYRLIK